MNVGNRYFSDFTGGGGRSSESAPSLTLAEAVDQARAAYEGKDYASARRLMESVADEGGVDDEFFHNLGLICMADEDYLSAIRAFDESIPSIPDGLVNRGYCWEMIDEVERARADYMVALGINPDNVDAIVNLGTLELACGQVDLAGGLLSRAADIDSQCNWQLADVFIETGNLEKAERALRLAISAGETRASAQLAEVRETIQRASLPEQEE